MVPAASNAPTTKVPVHGSVMAATHVFFVYRCRWWEMQFEAVCLRGVVTGHLRFLAIRV